MGINVYNTLSRNKEPLIPLKAGKIGMYVCGPTTYNYIHLGNARPLVVFDTVRRYLEYLGFEVTFVQNFTDVDDKIIRRAREEKRPPLELARAYTEEYFVDADALQVKRATVYPKVSEHMDDIIAFVKGLQEKGFAYEIDGDVYFAVNRFEEYGKLSGRTLDDLQAGARVEVDDRKRYPGDFALWKKAKPDEPSWDSPWGPGRPGWHIECSTMSCKYLGPSFDIHAGGFDLVFPHHENEIAQSEAFNGVQMAKYWLHNGFITINQEKMSKSLGNFFLLRDILKKFPAQVVRFYLLATHYRSPLDFDDEKLEAAGKGLERLQTAYRLLQEKKSRLENDRAGETSPGARQFRDQINEARRKFEEAMNDDFNTALAIAVFFDFARTINTYLAGGPTGAEALSALKEGEKLYTLLGSVLGLQFADIKAGRTDTKRAEEVEALIQKRQEAKSSKDYRTADAIRDELKKMGVILEDTPGGTRWRNK